MFIYRMHPLPRSILLTSGPGRRPFKCFATGKWPSGEVTAAAPQAGNVYRLLFKEETAL